MDIYFISDLHFGIRNASKEWLDNQLSYFNDFFIPTVEKKSSNKKKHLILAGDIFDNRQSVNIYIYYNVFNLFKKLATIFESIHIILGNHDISSKTAGEVSLVTLFQMIPNINVYTAPSVASIAGLKFLMLPWHHDGYKNTPISKENATYCVIHNDIKEIKYNSLSTSFEGISLKSLKDFKKIFGGHIHYRQERGNLIILGTPYHINRGDLGNRKGIYKLDAETEAITFIENTYSPEYKQLKLDDIMEMTYEELVQYSKNSYLYIEVNKHLSLSSQLSLLMNDIKEARNIKVIYYNEPSMADDGSPQSLTIADTKSIKDMLIEFIKMNSDVSDEVKKIAIDKILSYISKN